MVTGPEDETPTADGYGKCRFCARVQWDKFNQSARGRERFDRYNASTKGIVRNLRHDVDKATREAHLATENSD